MLHHPFFLEPGLPSLPCPCFAFQSNPSGAAKKGPKLVKRLHLDLQHNLVDTLTLRMHVQFLCISMYGHYLDTYSDYMDNVQIVFRLIFIYYSHCIQIRTLYSHFMHIIQIICVWYSDYLQNYLQTAQTWLPDLIAAPCVD